MQKKHWRTAAKISVPFVLAVVLITALWPAAPSEAAQGTTHVDNHGWQMDLPADWDIYTSGGPDEPGVVVQAYLPKIVNGSTVPGSLPGTLVMSATVDVSYAGRNDADPSWYLNELACTCDPDMPVVSSTIEPIKIGERWGAYRVFTTADGSQYLRLYITNDCDRYYLDIALAADATPETADALNRAIQSIRLDASRSVLGRCWD